ncbi:MAG: hypothetical protein PVI90_06025 [Desulfobacteraceae bacterium]
MIGLILINLYGCHVFDEEESSNENSPDITTNGLKVFLPSKVEKVKNVKGDYDGAFLKSGQQALNSENTVSDEADQQTTEFDIAGFTGFWRRNGRGGNRLILQSDP